MEKLKVVIADDMQVIAENNKRIATLFDNIEVVGIANNGQEEYDMIMELKPDLVITDNQMPLMNGVDVIEKINSSSITKKPQFILVTADTGEVVKKSYELGVFKVVHKSSSQEQLKYAIDDFLYLQNSNESDIIKKQQEKSEGFFEKLAKRLKG